MKIIQILLDDLENSERSQKFSNKTFNEKVLMLLENVNVETIDITQSYCEQLFLLYKKNKKAFYLQLLAIEIVLYRSEDYFNEVYDRLSLISEKFLVLTSIKNLLTFLNAPRKEFKYKSFIWSVKDNILVSKYIELAQEITTLIRKQDNNVTKINENSFLNIAVIVNGISPIKNQTGTKLILDYIAGLSTNPQIQTINLILTHESSIGQESNIVPFSFQTREFDIKATIRKNYSWLSNEDISKIQILDKMRKVDFRDYVHTFVDLLNKVNSDCILSFDHKPSVIMETVSKRYPTILIPIQIGLQASFQPIRQCIMKHDSRALEKKFNNFFVIDRQISYPLDDSAGKSENIVKTNSNELIFITAAYDLDKRVEEERMGKFFQVIEKILLNNKNAKYVLVGVPNERSEKLLSYIDIQYRKELEKRIVFLENDPNFSSLVRQCDVFLMPYHKGGGRSIRTALYEGLVAITLDNNDGNLYMDPYYIVSSEEEMLKMIEQITISANSLEEHKSRSNTFFKNLDNETTIKKFVQGIKTAITDFYHSKVLVIGDSHANVFNHIKILEEKWKTDIVQVHGATLSGLDNPNSKTGSIHKFVNAIHRTISDNVVFLLGEVDLGFVLWYRSERDNINISLAMDKALKNYDKLISLARKKVSNVIVISAPLPTISELNQDGDVAKARMSIKATQYERTELTLTFNKKVNEICDKYTNVNFLNLDEASLGNNGLVKNSLLNSNPLDHHYNQKEYAKILENKLMKQLV